MSVKFIINYSYKTNFEDIMAFTIMLCMPVVFNKKWLYR